MERPPIPRNEQPTQLVARRDLGVELAAGTALEEFVVEGLVGIGGYSIVYRARDTRLDRIVAIKEYIPATLSTRRADGRVVARTPRHQGAFDLGLKGFVNEARLLASFDHPALVKVYRFWAANGSAYMAMPFYEGITLRRWLNALGAPPSERWLREFAARMTEALDVLHRARCFHRDVAPDNILLLRDPRAKNYLEQPPRPLLLDFGAARRVIGEATQNLTSILKPGYSPLEQYDGEVSMRQGPWTDVYALCGVLYAAVAGKAPASAIARAVKDEMLPAQRLAAGRFGAPFLAAIDAGLALLPAERPQSMAALRERFAAAGVAVAAASVPVASPSSARASPVVPTRRSPAAAAGGWRGSWRERLGARLPAWLGRWLA